jgi:hypothetical protein
MVIGGRPVSDPGDEDFRPIRKKSADGGSNNPGGANRGNGGDRGRKDER